MAYNYDVSLEIEVDNDNDFLTYEASLNVSATMIPYARATRDEPEEGGFFDDVELVEIIGVFLIDAEGGITEAKITHAIRNVVDKAMETQSDEILRQLGEEEYKRTEEY